MLKSNSNEQNTLIEGKYITCTSDSIIANKIAPNWLGLNWD